MSEPELGAARMAFIRRIESSAVGSRALQRLAELAVRLLSATSAEVCLLGDVELVVGGAGLPPGAIGRSRPVEDSLALLVGPGTPLVVADTAADPRVAALSAVREGGARACVGMALTVSDGDCVGALCVFSEHPREWEAGDLTLLRQLADSVSTELQLSALSREYEASRLRFELAIDAAEIGSFDFDLVTGRLAWDDRLIDLFGYDRVTFDQTLAAFNARLHPDDLSRVQEDIQRTIDTCGVLETEYRILLPTGETRWVMGRGRAFADDRGVAVRLIGAAYDTTGQRHGDARVARVLETMSAAFLAVDRQWRFTYVNGEAERLLQHSREQLLGGSLWDLFPHAVGSEFEVHYREAMATGEERTFEAYYPPPLDGWYEVRAWPGPDGLSVYFVDITERRAAEARARASAARLAVIAEVTSLLSRALGPGKAEDSALCDVAYAVVPVLGDWVIASLMDEDGRIRDVGTWHVDPDLRETTERYGALRLTSLEPASPFPTALREGHVMHVDPLRPAVANLLHGEIGELFDRLDARSALVLPLMARGRTLGGLSIYRTGDRPPMDPEEIAAAREVADRTALALDNSRLYEQQRRLAEALQRSMLTAPPAPDHAEIVVRYHPALEVAQVGGDWYDAFLQADGATVLVIGDVVGHDTAAAAAMGQMRGVLRGIAFGSGATPAEILSELDAAMRGLEMGTMATAAIARVEQTPEERAAGVTRLRWSNAGHPPPLLLHPDGRIEELGAREPELMLGVDASARRTDSVTTFRRGATVLLYTDGLIEGRKQLLDDGLSLLREALVELADLPLQELCDRLIDRLRPGGLEDDVALVAIRLHPQDRPRPSEAGPTHVPPGVAPEG